MLFVVASIACSTVVLILFRLISRSSTSTLPAIVVSYLVSATMGGLLFPFDWRSFDLFWVPFALLGGVVLYLGFSLVALTTQRNGVAVAGIATKMSVVIPVSIGILWLSEGVGWMKLAGVAAGLVSVLLVSLASASKDKPVNCSQMEFIQSPNVTEKSLSVRQKSTLSSWQLPLLVFIVSGLTDASYKLLQVAGLSEPQLLPFIVVAFASAFVTSGIHLRLAPERQIDRRCFLFGIALGVANFGTLYFIMRALAVPDWESSLIYPMNHFGVVLSSVVVGVVLFRESLPRTVAAGVLLAVLSIALLALASR